MSIISSVNIDDQYDKIYRYCYFKLKNQHIAEDITQETFLRFLESSSYKDTGRPLAYLYTIARNLCIDEFRKASTEELKEEIVQNGFEEEVIERHSLQQAMETLTKEEQELLLLRYVNEVAFADLCKISKITSKLERRISDGT